MADTTDLKSVGSNTVRVRVPYPAFTRQAIWYFMTEKQATAIIESMFRNLYDLESNDSRSLRQARIALIVCDATFNDTSLKPLFMAYVKAKEKRGIA